MDHDLCFFTSHFLSNPFWALTKCARHLGWHALSFYLILATGPGGEWILLTSPFQRLGNPVPRSSLSECGHGHGPPTVAAPTPGHSVVSWPSPPMPGSFLQAFLVVAFKCQGGKGDWTCLSHVTEHCASQIIHDHQDSTGKSFLKKPLFEDWISCILSPHCVHPSQVFFPL